MSKFIQNLKLNFQNASWWVGLISGAILIGNAFGFNLTKYIGADWQNTINILTTFGVLHGVSANTKIEKGSDSNEIVQTTSQDENISSLAVNTINTINTSNTPVNPDNIKEHNQEVNAVTYTTPM